MGRPFLMVVTDGKCAGQSVNPFALKRWSLTVESVLTFPEKELCGRFDP